MVTYGSGRQPHRRWLSVTIVVLVVVLGSTAAWSKLHGGPGSPASPSTFSTGNATSPVQVTGTVVTVGGLPAQTSQAARHGFRAPVVVTGTTALGGHTIRYLSTDSRGRFALKLQPGVYTINSYMQRTRITVRRGHPIHPRITVQTK